MRNWSMCGMLLLSAFLLGCGEEKFQVETVLSPNGDVTRRACVPEAYAVAPPESGTANWAQKQHVSGARIERHSGPLAPLFQPESPEIAKRGSSGPTEKHQLVAGKFTAGTLWPAEFEITGQKQRHSSPQRDIQHEDLGFVIVHHWNETIPDVVTLADHRKARVEVAERARKITLATLVEMLGEDLDTQPLDQWLRDVATNLFFDACDALYAVSAQQRELEPRNQLLHKHMTRLMQEYNIPVLNEQGDFLQHKLLEAAVQNYLRAQIFPLLKRKNGQPVDVAALEAYLDLQLKSRTAEDEQMYAQHPYTQAALRVWKCEFPDDEAAGAYFEESSERLFGLYQGLLVTPRRFHYSLDYTGMILKTDGRLEPDSRIVWEFEGQQVFPHGYKMTAEIASPQRVLIDALVGAGRLTQPREVAAFVKLMREDGSLSEVLRNVIKEKSWDAWTAHRAKLANDGNDDEAAVADKIEKLLGR